MDAAMRLKPDLQLSIAAAQAIVDQAVSDQAVATVSRLHGGEIGRASCRERVYGLV